MKIMLDIDEINLEGVPVNDRDGLRRSLQTKLAHSMLRQFAPDSGSAHPRNSDGLSDAIADGVSQAVHGKMAVDRSRNRTKA